jgi:hypothetical protein
MLAGERESSERAAACDRLRQPQNYHLYRKQPGQPAERRVAYAARPVGTRVCGRLLLCAKRGLSDRNVLGRDSAVLISLKLGPAISRRVATRRLQTPDGQRDGLTAS